MSFGLINTYTEIYRQQDYVNTQALAIVYDEPKTAAFLRIAGEPSALSSGDIQSMLVGLVETDIRLATLQSIMGSLDKMYAEAVKTL